MDFASLLMTTNCTPFSRKMAPQGNGYVNRMAGGGLIIDFSKSVLLRGFMALS